MDIGLQLKNNNVYDTQPTVLAA